MIAARGGDIDAMGGREFEGHVRMFGLMGCVCA